MGDLVPVEKKPPRLVGRGMPGRLGPILWAFARRYLDPIPYPQEAIERLSKLAEQGVIVYIHRARNPLSHLALSRALRHHHLPVACFTGGLNVLWFQGFFRVLGRKRGLRGAPEETGRREEWMLQRTLRRQEAAELFLRRPLTLMTTSSTYPARYIEALISLQRNLDTPIFLVPHFLAMRGRPHNKEPTVADAVFGTQDEPGVLRAFMRGILSRGQASWEVSEAIDLRAFVNERSERSDEVLAKQVRWSMLHHLARSERVTHGPLRKSHERLRDDVLKDSNLQSRIFELSASDASHHQQQQQPQPQPQKPVQVESEPQLNARAARIFEEIAARLDIDVIRFGDAVLKRVWSLIYDGVEVEPKEMATLRETARKGPLVIVPGHRSHIDYLVVSQVLHWNGFHPPLIAAGENLNFFPFGWLARRGGAYFIRRSFKGDKLYGTVFRAYVKRLFKEGFTQEFFIEGGRSRTGKTLAPKLGLAGMLVDAFLESREDDAFFIPANISYEKIVEGRSYLRELRGGKKQKETASALISAGAGIVRSRYGRVFVTFDVPISLKAFIAQKGLARDAITPEQRLHLVRSLGYRIVYGINRAQVVTANALVITVLFGLRRRGVEREVLAQQVRELVRHVRLVAGDSARFSTGLEEAPQAQVDLAIDRLIGDGKVRAETAAGQTFLRVDEGAVLELDYYKNNIIHHFVPDALLSAAMQSLDVEDDGNVSLAVLKQRTRLLSNTFKFEFIYRVDRTFDQLFDGTIKRALRYGVLVTVAKQPDRVRIADDPRAQRLAEFSANLLANFIDTYWAVFDALTQAVEKTDNRKTLTLELLEQTKARFLSGALRCPEAVSKSNVEGALNLAVDLGAISFDAEGRPSFDPAWSEQQRKREGAPLSEVLKATRLSE